MNYGYAGTREINEALASRFMVVNMPIISGENLKKLLLAQFPELTDEYAGQFSDLFQELREKCDSSEISTKALDLRGLIAALQLVKTVLASIKRWSSALLINPSMTSSGSLWPTSSPSVCRSR